MRATEPTAPAPARDHQRAPTELDPDRRIVAMLGARGTVVALEGGAENEALQ
jgi:hypothetical protein